MRLNYFIVLLAILCCLCDNPVVTQKVVSERVTNLIKTTSFDYITFESGTGSNRMYDVYIDLKFDYTGYTHYDSIVFDITLYRLDQFKNRINHCARNDGIGKTFNYPDNTKGQIYTTIFKYTWTEAFQEYLSTGLSMTDSLKYEFAAIGYRKE